MRKLTVISGKGGTGKTSLVGCFAALARREAVMVDGDVDAANLSLILRPRLLEKHEFRASHVAEVNRQNCTQCGLCRELCRFDALSADYCVDPLSCEGCAFCFHACPDNAIAMVERVSGQWFVSSTPYGTLVHARLGIAEENSGKLVTKIRTRAQDIASGGDLSWTIIDGPPGIGCPVIASLAGVDRALVVTEPTVSGIHDMMRVTEVCRHFGVPVAVCINRFDLDESQSGLIEGFCRKERVQMVGKIPFDRVFVEAMVAGVPVIEYTDGPLVHSISEAWEDFSGSPAG